MPVALDGGISVGYIDSIIVQRSDSKNAKNTFLCFSHFLFLICAQLHISLNGALRRCKRPLLVRN